MCHDVDLHDAAVVHAPSETGDCTSCHDPHGGTTRALLKAHEGDTVNVRTPGGLEEIEILEVAYLET